MIDVKMGSVLQSSVLERCPADVAPDKKSGSSSTGSQPGIAITSLATST